MNLIVCPLKKEWECFAFALSTAKVALKKEQNQGQWYYDIPGLNAVLCYAKPGDQHFRIFANRWIDFFPNVEAFWTIGTAGAISENILPLDVIAVLEIIHINEKRTEGTQLEPIKYTTSFDRSFNFQKKERSFSCGTLASTEREINDNETKKKIFQDTGALAVSLESAAGAALALERSLNYFELRGITDQADTKTHTDFNRNLEPAMHHCAQTFLNIIKSS